MSFAANAGQLAWSSSPCECHLRKDTLRTLKRALREEPLDGRNAILLCAAAMALEVDFDLDPRAVLQLFPTRNELPV